MEVGQKRVNFKKTVLKVCLCVTLAFGILSVMMLTTTKTGHQFLFQAWISRNEMSRLETEQDNVRRDREELRVEQTRLEHVAENLRARELALQLKLDYGHADFCKNELPGDWNGHGLPGCASAVTYDGIPSQQYCNGRDNSGNYSDDGPYYYFRNCCIWSEDTHSCQFILPNDIAARSRVAKTARESVEVKAEVEKDLIEARQALRQAKAFPKIKYANSLKGDGVAENRAANIFSGAAWVKSAAEKDATGAWAGEPSGKAEGFLATELALQAELGKQHSTLCNDRLPGDWNRNGLPGCTSAATQMGTPSQQYCRGRDDSGNYPDDGPFYFFRHCCAWSIDMQSCQFLRSLARDAGSSAARAARAEAAANDTAGSTGNAERKRSALYKDFHPGHPPSKNIFLCITGQLQRLTLDDKLASIIRPLQIRGYTVHTSLVLQERNGESTQFTNDMQQRHNDVVESTYETEADLQQALHALGVFVDVRYFKATTPINNVLFEHLNKLNMPELQRRHRAENHLKMYTSAFVCGELFGKKVKQGYDFSGGGAIKMREDTILVFNVSQIASIPEKTIVTPACESWNGINDKAMLIHSDIAERVLKLPLQMYPGMCQKNATTCIGIRSPETFLKHVYEMHGIRIQQIESLKAFVVRNLKSRRCIGGFPCLQKKQVLGLRPCTEAVTSRDLCTAGPSGNWNKNALSGCAAAAYRTGAQSRRYCRGQNAKNKHPDIWPWTFFRSCCVWSSDDQTCKPISDTAQMSPVSYVPSIYPLPCPQSNYYMSYVPHSGWGNQVFALGNALAIARALSRVLILPGVLHHHANPWGTCEKPSSIESSLARYAKELQRGRVLGLDKVLNTSSLGTEAANCTLQCTFPPGYFRGFFYMHVLNTTCTTTDVRSTHNETLCLDAQTTYDQIQRFRGETSHVLSFDDMYATKLPAYMKPQHSVSINSHVYTCRIQYRLDIQKKVKALAQAMSLGNKYDALHLRLKENRLLHSRGMELLGHALLINTNTPLYIATDDSPKLAHMLDNITDSGHRKVFTSLDWPAFETKDIREVLGFMAETVTDILLCVNAVAFTPSTGSYGRHIEALRECNKHEVAKNNNKIHK